MKKLPIFERVDYGDPYMKDTVYAKIHHRDVVVTWKWQEDFDLTVCASFFEHFRDVIMKLDAPYTSCDEAARLFLLGCSFDHSVGKCDDPFDVDIMEFGPKS